MDSRLLYLDKLGIWVGEFTDDEISRGMDKEVIETFKELTGLKYVNKRVNVEPDGTRFTRFWVCKKEDVSQDKGKTGIRKDYKHE